MDTIAAIMQPFCLIALGFALVHLPLFPRTLWEGVEKLVYYVLFPPLLFTSVAKADFVLSETGLFLAGGIFAMATGVYMAHVVSRLAPADPMTDASVRQTGYRFNSYICFAIALSIYGTDGLALVALLTGFWVPISNALAVADLVKSGADKGHKAGPLEVIASICKNPLIVGTLGGLAANLAGTFYGFKMPEFVMDLFGSLGSASVATALMAIGAGLAVEDFRRYAKLIALSTVQRLIVLPAVACIVGLVLQFNDVELGALMCYAVVPTANSCYIMAVRMGGNGPVVSDLTSVEVIASLATIPAWMSLLAWLAS